MAPNLFAASFGAGSVLLVLLGLLDVLFLGPHITDPNPCVMTRMRPSYAPVLSPDLSHPRYNLWRYREVGLDDPADDAVRGIPVIFVPGNAGSHMQVRSAASEAARRSSSGRLGVRFEFFAVDSAVELSAFSGTSLSDQREFLARCVRHVASLYRSERRVILLGHSMGGIVAEATAAEVGDLVSAVVTLNAPHRRPIVENSAGVYSFYSNLANSSTVPTVSIASGFRDTLVRSELSDLGKGVGEGRLSVFTTSLDNVWVEADHLCVVWCNQIVVAVDGILREIAAGPTAVQAIERYRRGLLKNSLHLMMNGQSLVSGVAATESPSGSTKVDGDRIFLNQGGKFSVYFDLEERRDSGQNDLFVMSSSKAGISVLLCQELETSKCHDAWQSAKLVPTGHLLRVSEVQLHKFKFAVVLKRDDREMVRVSAWVIQSASPLAYSRHAFDTFVRLPGPNAFEYYTKTLAATSARDQLLHFSTDKWSPRRVLGLSTSHTSEVLAMYFCTPSSSSMAPQQFVRVLKPGGSLRIACHVDASSLDVYLVPLLTSKSSTAEVTTSVWFDKRGMLGQLVHECLPTAMGVALALMAVHAVVARRGPSLLKGISIQVPAAVLALSSLSLAAPMWLPLGVDVMTVTGITAAAIAVVVWFLCSVVVFVSRATPRILRSLLVPSSLGVQLAALAVVGLALATCSPFVTLVASWSLLLLRTPVGCQEDKSKCRALLTAFLLPCLLSSIEPGVSGTFKRQTFDGYEVSAAIAALHAVFGPVSLLGGLNPRISNLVAPLVAVPATWFAFNWPLSSAFMSLASLL